MTTYWGWVFGAFSEGTRVYTSVNDEHILTAYAEYTRAWVSEIVTWDSAKPTVLEYLFYWFASATNQRGGWTIPQVSVESKLGRVLRFPSTFRSLCLDVEGKLDHNLFLALTRYP